MKSKLLLGFAAMITAGVMLGACTPSQMDHHDMHDMHANMWSSVTHAVAVLQPTQGNNVHGVIKFEQTPAGVHITGQITGLAPNSTHGFHIHEFGDASSADGSAAGGHYNPEGAAHQHAGMDNPMRHAGDLGNVQADGSGAASIDVTDPDLSIAGMNHPIIGRGLVLHANADDLKSQPAGNAGPRIAVGVIGIAK